ncbi:hypothetical protein G3480_12395 [Thiorhodococcus mannitoliphagus]|uniref:Uncharacterized protein n=1 Tax=Thiorhodococcus mannitoliphagus TaxID=329406 RepID=A0A6P1DVS3_9GAMM|nr:hypothetical protein [Thiorhodococcus mannitoliphagus]NEX21101.1 hypothetical protein [Thiorhodococcus mannitoliphagus]
MNRIKPFLLALTIGPCAWQAANGQDYVGYVEQLAAQAGQRAQMHAQNAITLYRQQTGDWSTPDQQVLAHLDALSRQQNPGFYSDLQQREQAFQTQQDAYVKNSNAVLDGMYNSYMDRSAAQYQGHQNYTREGIWERSHYTDGNEVYELPYYQPGQVYEGYDGSTMIQDEYGQYQHYDAYGWQSEMEQYDPD